MTRQLKVLVVNDTADTLALLVRVVRRSIPNVSIDVAASYQEGLTKIHADLDIAVVDYHLDSEDHNSSPSGVDLLSRIQQVAGGCYLILVSKTVDKKPNLHGQSLMLDAYISLRYRDTNPMSLLREKLRQAKDRQLTSR